MMGFIKPQVAIILTITSIIPFLMLVTAGVASDLSQPALSRNLSQEEPIRNPHRNQYQRTAPAYQKPYTDPTPPIVEFEAIGTPLRTRNAKQSELKGTYTVIFCGRDYLLDLETVAILQSEETGKYTFFHPVAPEYRIMQRLDAKKALEEAEKFVSGHPNYWRSQLSKIINSKGETVGYEVRPLYHPFTYGLADVLDISYKIGPTYKFSSVVHVNFPKSVVFTIHSRITP